MELRRRPSITVQLLQSICRRLLSIKHCPHHVSQIWKASALGAGVVSVVAGVSGRFTPPPPLAELLLKPVSL